jgi:hypothetical protein
MCFAGHIMVNCGSLCAREAEGQNVQEMMDSRLQWRSHLLWQGLQEKVGGTGKNTLALMDPLQICMSRNKPCLCAEGKV